MTARERGVSSAVARAIPVRRLVLSVVGILLLAASTSCGRGVDKLVAQAGAPPVVGSTQDSAPAGKPFDVNVFQPRAPEGWHYSHTFRDNEGPTGRVVLVTYESDVRDQEDLTGRPAGRTINVDLIDADPSLPTSSSPEDVAANLHKFMSGAAFATAVTQVRELTVVDLPAVEWTSVDGVATNAVAVATNSHQILEITSPTESHAYLADLAARVIGS